MALDLHDPATRDFVQRVGNDLRIRSEGGDCSSALEHEVKSIRLANLNESIGESIHRGTNLEAIRAPRSTSIAVKKQSESEGGGQDDPEVHERERRPWQGRRAVRMEVLQAAGTGGKEAALA